MKLYIASSWRNVYYEALLEKLREADHQVYDWRSSETAFRWEAISTGWESWSTGEFFIALEHPLSEAGFNRDMNALEECDAAILLLPSGRSAHLEAGWVAGAEKPLAVYIPPGVQMEPELMYKMAQFQTSSEEKLLRWLYLLGKGVTSVG